MQTAVGEATRAVPNGHPEERPLEVWNWRVPPWRGDTDAATARAARTRRTAWRLDHPAAWRAGLEQLDHFEPEYNYDVVHEYEDEWTTDPDYGGDGIHLREYDEDGFVSPEHRRHMPFLMAMLDVLVDMLGNRVEHEVEMHFSARIGKMLGLLTGKDEGKSQVKPDLMVLPRALELPTGRERSKEGRTIRLDAGHPVPELVVEIVSPTSEHRDLEDKLELYAVLGITEYLACDPGTPPDPDADDPGSPAELLLFQLQPNGTYRQADDVSACYSNVCGTHVRLWQPDVQEMPRFQWRDTRLGRWRDRETDREREQAERMEMALGLLHAYLGAELDPADLDRIEAAWRGDGLPDNVMDRILAVRKTPSEWRVLLLPAEPHGTGSDRTLTPREPRILRDNT